MSLEHLVRKHPDLFGKRIQELGDSLGAAAKRVIEYIDQNRGAALASSAAEIAKAAKTSDATVIRVVQTLGFSGLSDLKRALGVSVDTHSRLADNMRRTLAEVGEDAGVAVNAVLKAHRMALAKLQSPDTRKRILSAAAKLQHSKRIVLFGIGPTGFIANYIGAQLQRTGRRTKILDATGLMLADQLLDLHGGDSLLALAYDPPYPEIMTVFHEAKRLRLDTVLITNKQESTLAGFADIVIPVMRGRAERVALHGVTVICLEALVLSLAATNRKEAGASLEKLGELRQRVTASSSSTK